MQIGENANFDDVDGIGDGNGRWNGSNWSGLADNNGVYNGKAWSDLRGLADGNGRWNGSNWSGLADGNGTYNSANGSWNGLADGNGSFNTMTQSWNGLADGNGVYNSASGSWNGLADNNGHWNGSAWSDLAQGYLPAELDTRLGPVAMDGYFGQLRTSTPKATSTSALTSKPTSSGAAYVKGFGYFGQADDEHAAAVAAGATWSGRIEVKDAATGGYIPSIRNGQPNNVMVTLMAGKSEVSKVAADAAGNAAFINMIAPANSPLTYKVEVPGYETKLVPAVAGSVVTVGLVRQSAMAGMNIGAWLLVAGAVGVIGWNLWKK